MALMQNHKSNYGIDAPGLLRMFIFGAVVCVSITGAIYLWNDTHSAVALTVTTIFGLLACYLTGMACLMIYESKVTKVKGRDAILDLVNWRGDEKVLDIGCGRGLLLIGAAKRLTSGKATGIDIWQAKDQSQNSPQGAIDNAFIESVTDKIEIQTADMRALPFMDGTFDVVMSHWTLHNLELETDRVIALNEMNRVLRPGGRLILTDIEHRNNYIEHISALGLYDISVLVKPIKDVILKIVSFGSFRPATITAIKPA